MATRVVMPQMGYDMKQGTVVRWLKREGEPVQRGEAIAEIETDKAIVVMQAYASGVLSHIVASEGAVVPVGQLIAIIGAPDEATPPEWLQATSAPSLAAMLTRAATPVEALPEPAAAERARSSPLARRLAQEHGVDLGQIRGSGPGGRIVEEDVRAHLAQQKAPVQPAAPGPMGVAPPRSAITPVAAASLEGAPAQVVELSRMRQAIARITTRANQEVPHFYVTTTVHMDAAMALRQDLNQALEGQGVRVSVNDLIIKACTLALQKHPILSSSYQEGRLLVHPGVNIGVAVAIEGGLIVPVVAGCDKKSLVEVARAAHEVIQRAQEGKLTEAEYTGGTFSISNLGMYDVDHFTAIIFPPQAAVLAVGSVQKQPVVVGEQVKVAQVMKVTLSVDHRVADGVQAAQFLGEVKRVLEHPAVLLLSV
ncbi:MAG: 2-oxo acid dehydrogenase subunit E2 [Dehalococcoidia bacterium]|nr:2-oxo acid dehydrogenase subunit E2 [Dehalococcoidia bacterium]